MASKEYQKLKEKIKKEKITWKQYLQAQILMLMFWDPISR
jgi:hypothetical protein